MHNTHLTFSIHAIFSVCKSNDQKHVVQIFVLIVLWEGEVILEQRQRSDTWLPKWSSRTSMSDQERSFSGVVFEKFKDSRSNRTRSQLY